MRIHRLPKQEWLTGLRAVRQMITTAECMRQFKGIGHKRKLTCSYSFNGPLQPSAALPYTDSKSRNKGCFLVHRAQYSPESLVPSSSLWCCSCCWEAAWGSEEGAVGVAAVAWGVCSGGCSVLTILRAGASAVAEEEGEVSVRRKSMRRANFSMLSCSCGCAKSLLAMRRTALLRVSAWSPEAASRTTCRASDLHTDSKGRW